jgi:hypothetical protein
LQISNRLTTLSHQALRRIHIYESMDGDHFIETAMDLLCGPDLNSSIHHVQQAMKDGNALSSSIIVQRNERAVLMRQNRISKSTRKTYDGYTKRFVDYVRKKYPQMINSDENVMLEHVSLQLVENFLTEQKSRKRNETDQVASVGVLKRLRAAIRNYYVDMNVPLPEWFKNELSPLFAGLQREEARSARLGEKEDTDEGKQPFTFSMYSTIMLSILTKTVNPFMHLFAVLAWNLMCRGDNVQDINLRNVSWREDALLIKLGHAKNDQTGELSISTEAKHCYANPIHPHICPILSFAIYLSTCFNAPDGTALFMGERQKDRMLTNLSTILHMDALSEELKQVGRKPKDYGNHSFRKGAATFVSSGSVGGPSVISVIRRAGWAVGDVLGRYLKADQAGDQYVGRVVSGLPINSHLFAALPPRFYDSSQSILVDELIMKQFPNCTHLSNLSLCLRHFLASLIYHEDFLKKNLPSNHVLFLTPLFQTEIRKSLVVKCQTEICDETATGIPPHISQLQYLKSLSTERIIEGVAKLLNDRELESQILTTAVLQKSLGELRDEIIAEMQKNREDDSNTQQSRRTGENAGKRIFWSLWRDGKYRRLPESFEFPSKCTLELAWRLWYCGAAEKSWSAFCLIEGTDLRCRKLQKELSEWKMVLSHYRELLLQQNVGTELICTHQGYQSLFKFGVFQVERKKKNTIRHAQKSLLTLAKEIRKARKPSG